MNGKRSLVVVVTAVSSAVLLGWCMGMMDFVAPDLVRALRGDQCSPSCGVQTSWVLGTGFVGGLIGGVVALVLSRPMASAR